MNQTANTPPTVSLGSPSYRQLLSDLPNLTRGILLIHGANPLEQEEAATTMARDLSLDLHHANLGDIISKYIGNTEKELAEHFAQANQEGATLFLAGADALFGKRVEVDGCFLRYRDTEANRLFQLGIDQPGFVFMGSATLPEGPGPWDGLLTAIVG
ncbi:MAG: ATP-binding protein [Deltaproteobacteria bacterium]|nr:ATP-binding protein [Deltaproteobacteria bacterium]